jgi:hypothetical protein
VFGEEGGKTPVPCMMSLKRKEVTSGCVWQENLDIGNFPVLDATISFPMGTVLILRPRECMRKWVINTVRVITRGSSVIRRFGWMKILMSPANFSSAYFPGGSVPFDLYA